MERTVWTALDRTLEGSQFVRKIEVPGWERSWIASRTLGLGKVGLGCGRVLVSGECLVGDEGRSGRGEAVGSEVVLMARGTGRGFED